VLSPHIQGLPSPWPGVALWYVALDAPSASAPNHGLNWAEERRAQAFVKARDGSRYRAAHAALREILAAGLDCLPAQLSFVAGPQGKPRLVAGASTLASSETVQLPQFSLSHSGGHGLIAVHPQAAVGVDIEALDKDLPGAPFDEALARQVLSSTEWHAWRNLAPADQPCAFLRAWTRKEACLKAWGLGLWADPAGVNVGWEGAVRCSNAPAPFIGGPVEVVTLSLPENLACAAALAWDGLAADPVNPTGLRHCRDAPEITPDAGLLFRS
jgi:4'-phosphopantetheinyl transferase